MVVGALMTIAAIAIVILVKHGAESNQIAPTIHTYATRVGQQANVTLTDGSRVLIGPATTLVVVMNPQSATPTVTVDGQALFTVTHHDRTPFTVKTANAVTRVLGTTFQVRRYATDRATHVMVVDGRVSVRGVHDAAATILDARTFAVVGDSGTIRIIPDIAADEVTGWVDGRLVFHDTPVREMLADIGRAYGVEIRVSDSTLANRQLTCTIPVADQSLDNVLTGLSALLDIHATRAGRVITLVPGRHAAPRSIAPHAPLLPSSESQYGR